MSAQTTPHARIQEFGDFSTQPRVLLLAAMAIVVGSFGVASAWVLLRLIALVTNIAYHGTLSTSAGLISLDTLGKWSILIPVAGSLIVGPHGPIRVREDPRSRYSRGAGSDSDRPKPDRRQDRGAQAALFGHCHRHRRTVRRRGTDHHDGRRARLLVRAVLPPQRCRAKDAAGGRRRRRYDGGIRHPDCRRPAFGRVAAVRMEAAQLHPDAGCLHDGDRGARLGNRLLAAIPAHRLDAA